MTPIEQLNAIMAFSADVLREEILQGLAYLGEECVKRVREKGRDNDWMDQTGNLRSSIGYAVHDHGVEFAKSTFNTVMDGTEGSQKGQLYIKEIAGKYADTYLLLVVAGMDYADYVETKRDVLASTETWAKNRIDMIMKRSIKTATKRIETFIGTL